MLKLERKSRDGQISVLVRNKEYLFNRTLLIALTWAVAVHLSFFAFFHIVPLKIKFSNTLLPPVSVESNIAGGSAASAAKEEPSPITFHGIPFPEFSTPALAEHPVYAATTTAQEARVSDPKKSVFHELESPLYIPAMTIPKALAQRPIDIIISGPLADAPFNRTMIEEDIAKRIAKYPPASDTRTVYSVLVEANTGKIFWFEAKEHTGVAPLDNAAESALRSLAFSMAPGKVEISGEIEIQFHRMAL